MKNKEPRPISSKEILRPIQKNLDKVEELLIKNLDAEIPLITEISRYVFQSGGKRVRPALLLFASGVFGEITEKACVAAAIIEYIHTATLLHDDVVDQGELRRSKKTPRVIWGNEASVLLGDYLVTKAFYYLASFKNHKIIKTVSNATNLMAKGEILQLSLDYDKAVKKDYLDIIYHKTATLMGASMSIGAILAQAGPEKTKIMSDCGVKIGVAFQLVDDALDYDMNNIKLGKQPGKDLKEKKITFPLKLLLEQASNTDAEIIVNILKKDEISDRDVSLTIDLMNKYRSTEHTLEQASEYVVSAKKSLALMPENEFTRGIENLADYIIVRKK